MTARPSPAKEREPEQLEEAAIWTGGKSWRLLGSVRPNAQPCDALLSSAFGTNDDGRVVVGLAWDGCSYARAFRWEEATGMVDLGSLSGASTRANGVSGDGRVVVGWEAPTGFREGAKWVDGRQELIKGPTGIGGRGLYAPTATAPSSPGRTATRPTPWAARTAWTWTQAAGVKCFPVARAPWVPRLPTRRTCSARATTGA